jgi:hypothetical protein
LQHAAAVILAVASGSGEAGNHNKRMAYRDAHTGWFFAQNIGATAVHLTTQMQPSYLNLSVLMDTEKSFRKNQDFY